MPKVFWWLLLLIIILTFFAAGIFLGHYYHNEITVIWHGIFPPPNQTPVPTPSPVDLSTASVINLPDLHEPLPLVYGDTLEEEIIQQQLKEGAVILPLGTSFGDPGNVVITAHSSGTQAFGPYRFAFAKLSELEEGTEYSISTPTATYHYRVYGKEVVWPHEVDKLPNDDRSTVTLVTCWPLWTNFQRLLVHAELIAVDYNI